MTETTLELALQYAESGLSIVPIRADGSKMPAVQWKQFQSEIAGPDEIRRMFSGKVGIAAICGRVSGNLEEIDFDSIDSYRTWYALVEQHAGRELLDKLVKIQTPRPGVAVVYRCDEIEGNQKLARRLVASKPEVLIETRGEGGYFILPGSPPECHPSGRIYELRHGNLLNIQNLPANERRTLLDLARSINEYIEPAKLIAKDTSGNGSRPGDSYAKAVQWRDILLPAGWRHVFDSGTTGYWRRPGKDTGVSATTNYKDSGLLYVFSTNAAPFQDQHSYSKFAAFTYLHAKGDFSEAARTLSIQGYGKEETQSNKQDNEVQKSYIEFAPQFLPIVDPPIQYLIDDLIPESILALIHGQPRTMKSWILLEIAISLATGTCAFGLSRFAARNALPVLYSSQEDSARDVRLRTKAILRGKGIDKYPETLAFSIHKGINLESYEWQEALIRDITKYQFRLVLLDPARRFAENVDKGPAEVRAVTGALRRIVVETKATILPSHHDVKPLRTDSQNEGRRGHRASGGDWFAAADCPISVDQAGPQSSLVIPEDYKFSVDPQAFSFKLETDHPIYPTTAKLIGVTTDAQDAMKFIGVEKVIKCLEEHPAGISGNAISQSCRMRREDVKFILEDLLKKGTVDCYGSGKRGAKQTWFIHSEKPRETLL